MFEKLQKKYPINLPAIICFKALHDKYRKGIHLMFDCSTRGGDLAKVQNYFDDEIMDVDEKQDTEFQEILKETISQFKEQNVNLFICDGMIIHVT